MDTFTENLLSRARERQRLLENYNDNADSRSPKKVTSQPNLNECSPKRTPPVWKNNSEGNITKVTHARLSSDCSSPKTLNIQNDNFNMEIKVQSADNIRVEVQIEEEETDDGNYGLRRDARNRLNRLGKLYAGGEDAEISSPIHQTEAKFATDESPRKTQALSKHGLSKLATLAQNINSFEDNLTSIGCKHKEETVRKSKKSPAPQPPKIASSVKPVIKSKAPSPPRSPEKGANNLKWDKKVLDTLEKQGFTRTQSSSHLIYKYETRNEKENIVKDDSERLKPTNKATAIAEKAAMFESSPNRNAKDPALLSVSERKALFEKNKGTPLIPKAPFSMATPPVKDSMATSPVKKNVIEKKDIPKKAIANKEMICEVPKAAGIASTVAALFENRNTISQEQIERSVQEQRKKDMDLLLNRFQRTIETVSEEPEFDEEATEETAMIEVKAPKIVECSSQQERRSSGNKRCNKSDSPKVAAVLSDVKRIKVSPQKAGRLYPCLTDIESTTETENETRSPSPNNISSCESSIAESDVVNTSFGRDILQAVCKNQTPQKKPLAEDDQSDLSDILDDMDDYIDEALAYNDGPTPPKQGRKSPIESSFSFNYKNYPNPEFKSPLKKTRVSTNREEPPIQVQDGDNLLPLTHTVSFYRKQQSQTANTPPARQISRPTLEEDTAENDPDVVKAITEKIKELKQEVAKQELMIAQTSQALNLCHSTFEFTGSTEQVEAERVLLVATHRRQAAMHEVQRLEVEKTLRPRRKDCQVPSQKGTLTISKIILPLKQKYVTALAAAGGKGHHVVCLVKYGAQVMSTQLVSTVASDTKNPELELNIPGTIKIEDIYSDFTLTFEVYCLQAHEELLPHDIKYHIKKPNVKLTPKKSKQDSRLIRPIKESPAGPQTVRSPTFALMGYVVLSKPAAANKKQWSLNNTPSMSPLEGTVEMHTSFEMLISVEHRGFLTMFEDVSGFGAWHRRWCLLKGDSLSYWKYPDDEKKSLPINSICLRDSITKVVGPVSRDMCARLHTFLIEIEREGSPHDKDSLVTVRRGDKTIIRHLLSSDTKEERITWCARFNSALSALNWH